MLNKDHAEKIAKKLKAEIRTGKAHDIAVIEYQGQRIAQFGIRRGSNRNQGHDHIQGSLHLNTNNTKKLAECTLSYEEWIQVMISMGLIENETGG